MQYPSSSCVEARKRVCGVECVVAAAFLLKLSGLTTCWILPGSLTQRPNRPYQQHQVAARAESREAHPP
eukprot:1146433-Pelagomonas_calceolata.AAC.9